jgi:uncharacterized protein (DUF58 family)
MWFSRAKPVVPDALPVRQREDLPALLARLDWTVLRRLDGLLQGDHRTLFKGAGLDLAELREYLPHDDVRHIDWMVTARTGAAHVREHLEDREIQAWFLVDLSGSMDVGSDGVTKRSRLLGFVAVMSRLLMMRGNRIGAMIWHHDGPQGMVHIPPRMGRRHALHVMQRLGETQAPTSPHQSPLDEWLRRAARLLPRRAEVFVLSDFLSPSPWEKALAELAHRHDGIVVRLTDPIESVLPQAGMFWAQDAETGEQIWVDSNDPGLRRRYSEQAMADRQRLAQAVTQAGMDALELSTQENLTDALLRFVQLRQLKPRHG